MSRVVFIGIKSSYITDRRHSQLEIGNVAEWFEAVATILAVVVALFKESILTRFRHPQLSAEIAARQPDCIKTPATHDDWSGSRYFLRIWIKNIGSVRAEKVEVFLSQALVEIKTGSFVPVPRFTSMNLRWSYTNSQNPETYVNGISPGMKRLCDLAAISEPTHPDLRTLPDNTKTRLALQIQALQPAAEWLLPGKYRFEITTAAANCDPVKHCIDFHLTGLWSDDPEEMLSNGFTVTITQESAARYG